MDATFALRFVMTVVDSRDVCISFALILVSPIFPCKHQFYLLLSNGNLNSDPTSADEITPLIFTCVPISVLEHGTVHIAMSLG